MAQTSALKKLAKEFAEPDKQEEAQDHECPFCIGIGPSPWYTCEECGAYYCSSCIESHAYTEDKKCLKCDTDAPRNRVKNIPALNKIKFYCLNKDHGCDEFAPFKEMIAHI